MLLTPPSLRKSQRYSELYVSNEGQEPNIRTKDVVTCALSKCREGGDTGDALLWFYASVERVMSLEFLEG